MQYFYIIFTKSLKGHYLNLYVSGVQSADWLDIGFASATSCGTAASLDDKNACAWPVLLAHIVYFLR
jgi:hypothetical protein